MNILMFSDVGRPEFLTCPADQTFNNVKYEAYYAWNLPLLTVRDNDEQSFIEQSVTIKQKGT